MLALLLAATAYSPGAILARCMEGPAATLGPSAQTVVSGYVERLLAYNERTNVYSKSAYDKLPFHVADSITLGLLIAEARSTNGAPEDDRPRGILDLGSGSGLPSVLIAAVNPDVPVFAVESKSRKTRFLEDVSRELGLDYVALTCNVNELSRSVAFDVEFVTAKVHTPGEGSPRPCARVDVLSRAVCQAFKPLREVGPIGAACVLSEATLHIPVSEAQAREISHIARLVPRLFVDRDEGQVLWSLLMRFT